ncbi:MULTISPECIES: hypothetical protein [Fructilactobacillus]|uniref:hypothetical protein n=1 Tax=Fructilactobacillus TaxID=2767881 RepID=UPI000CD46FAC|nr:MULTISPECIES: hypothetical protein [Fructilactobacillus]POH04371.1 hypothetical protein BGL33_07075 [Fructilactobacillus lindneri]POH14429.1 hypothetical protein BGL41_06860 [Fructilactobacillus sanfranciscensis]
MTVEIKDNHEMLKLVHELEDDYAFEDEFGNNHFSINNVPKNNPILKAIQKFNGEKLITHEKGFKTAYLYQAYDWNNKLVAEDFDKQCLMTKLRKVKDFKNYRFSLSMINSGLKRDHGKFYWGYIKIKEVKREVAIPKTYEYSAFDKDGNFICKAEGIRKLEAKLKNSRLKDCIGLSNCSIRDHLKKYNGKTRWGHVEIKEIEKIKRE